MAKKFRIYTNEELKLGKTITLNEEQTHYLKNVVKHAVSDELLCFDNKNGEFLCIIKELNKKNTLIDVIKQTKPFTPCPDIWLLFAPLKKDNTDFVIEKATELGVKKIIPTNTRYTNSSNIKLERFIAQSIEASEQCKRTDLPEISPLTNLSEILKNWDTSRSLFFMDETLDSKPFIEVLKTTKNHKSAILIGPEGGFSPEELIQLRNLDYAIGATLGPRILRAETAVCASLSCWQMFLGDWSNI